MVFNTGAALLDAVVLAMISHEPEGTYGYNGMCGAQQALLQDYGERKNAA